MTRAPARIERLKRLERVREAARLEAIAKASAAERQFTRQAELAQRSEQLASAFAQRWQAENAEDLRDLRAFHAGLNTLQDMTAQDSAQAQAAANIHRLEAAAAQRKRDLVADQRELAERGHKKALTAKTLRDGPHLARSLKGS